MSGGIGRSGASRTGAVAFRRGRCTRTRRSATGRRWAGCGGRMSGAGHAGA